MSTKLLPDRPVRAIGTQKPIIEWGSDAIVEQLARLNLKYIALVPGSSYRGVHDSLVNYMDNAEPQMLVCLHEEHSVAIAHGYAKVTERPMAAAVHANVGLMHATMAVYNAFCDRVPMVILGATGPVDDAKKRPWIDWIHSSTDQAALIRPFIKFDDQPHSVNAAVASLVRATAMTISKPSAPVYVCLDVHLQEDKIDPSTVNFPDTSRYLPSGPPGASQGEVEQVLEALKVARKPLFLFGRVNRSQESWDQRVRATEKYDARVLTDLKQASAFPTANERHACPPSVFNSPQASEVIRLADLIVSFDWVDLAGTLQAAHRPGQEPEAKIVHISLDSTLHNGWSKDHFGHAPVDIAIQADPDVFLTSLSETGPGTADQRSDWPSESIKSTPNTSNGPSQASYITMTDLANALYAALPPKDMCLVRVPLGWKGKDLRSVHPLSYLGQDGGAGVGSGPGQAVGATLALRDSALNPVAVLGDGDFLMGSSALWTAARYKLPLLVVVANNASFFNDEVHQERVARARNRPVENIWIGMRLDDPLPDLSMNARSLGLETVGGQVKDPKVLGDVIMESVRMVKEGKSVVLDVAVPPEGYSNALEKAEK